MEDAGINPAALLRRHVSGDWGDIHPEDDGLNEEALETGARIVSVYGTATDFFTQTPVRFSSFCYFLCAVLT